VRKAQLLALPIPQINQHSPNLLIFCTLELFCFGRFKSLHPNMQIYEYQFDVKKENSSSINWLIKYRKSATICKSLTHFNGQIAE
jgi:hypothetical protein